VCKCLGGCLWTDRWSCTNGMRNHEDTRCVHSVRLSIACKPVGRGLVDPYCWVDCGRFLSL
jgi:hypothetical protein